MPIIIIHIFYNLAPLLAPTNLRCDGSRACDLEKPRGILPSPQDQILSPAAYAVNRVELNTPTAPTISAGSCSMRRRQRKSATAKLKKWLR